LRTAKPGAIRVAPHEFHRRTV